MHSWKEGTSAWTASTLQLLFKEVGMTMIGTLQINQKGVPPTLKPTQGWDKLSYEVYWNANNPHMSLHSYVVRTKSTGPRNVLLLTTMKPILGVTSDDGDSTM